MRIDYSAEVDDQEAAKQVTSYGTMSLALLGQGVSVEMPETEAELSRKNKPLRGELQKAVSLAPGAEITVTVLLSWYFPTTKAVNATPRMMEDKQEYTAINQRYYAKKFRGAAAVSDYVAEHLDELASKTRLWRNNWYDSTLPFWFLDRTFLNASILASSTTSIINDGLLYGSEGGNQGPGTCTHVWGYVQAIGRLFPQLEKSLREQVDFVPVEEGGALTDEGVVKFRWFTTHGLAVDGQSGIILRSYLCHQMSPDNAFLKKNYAGIKTVMEGLTNLRDADHDGILTGAQHNTLDGDWYGKIIWLSLHYTTVLRAMAEMADEMDDHDYAKFCRETADKGRRYIEEKLFNGEYFFHEVDPDYPKSPGTYTGLEYSQLFGQNWAYQVGLGEVVDPVKATKALESMWRYNFTTDVGPFREVHKGGRWYAMPGEGGLIACTWPRGGSEVLQFGNLKFAAYNNECQNGYEYAATALMMAHGMPYHALAHTWYMHNDRYHGSKRNPWCEVEWGVHYSRSMASYGIFTAASGFEYHGPKGTIAFAPEITPESFKSAFTAAEGWGTFEQKRDGKVQSDEIAVKYGQLRLNEITLKVAADKQIRKAVVTVAGKRVKASYEQNGPKVKIAMNDAVVIPAGMSILVELK